MSVDIDLRFPHRFTCEVLDELPGTSYQRYSFPPDRVAGQDGIVLRVQPESGDRWTGMFAFGDMRQAGFNGVLSMPDPEKLCIVSRGSGYIVKASNPRLWETVRAHPIIDARAVPEAGIIVYADFTELIGHDGSGVRWRTGRLTWDRLKIVSVHDRTLVGESWDMREESTRRFEVDLVTGAVRPVGRLARIRWNSASSGGRPAPPGPSYSTVARFHSLADKWPHEAWSVVLQISSPANAAGEMIVGIRLLATDIAPDDLLATGARFDLFEGGRLVAQGEVLA